MKMSMIGGEVKALVLMGRGENISRPWPPVKLRKNWEIHRKVRKNPKNLKYPKVRIRFLKLRSKPRCPKNLENSSGNPDFYQNIPNIFDNIFSVGIKYLREI